MVKQHLEALHRVARPGMIARHDQIRRRRDGGAEPPTRLSRQEILYALGIPGNHAENLRRTDRPGG